MFFLICAHLRHLWIKKTLSCAQAMRAFLNFASFVNFAVHRSGYAAEQNSATQDRAFPTSPCLSAPMGQRGEERVMPCPKLAPMRVRVFAAYPST